MTALTDDVIDIEDDLDLVEVEQAVQDVKILELQMELESMFCSLKLMRLWKWICRDSQGFMGICKNLRDFGNRFVRIWEILGMDLQMHS